MAAVLGWGLWNQRLTEWFNPGGRRPYVASREAAERMRRAAMRQYPMGTWELREFVADEESEEESSETTDRQGEARPDTEMPSARRPGA